MTDVAIVRLLVIPVRTHAYAGLAADYRDRDRPSLLPDGYDDTRAGALQLFRTAGRPGLARATRRTD